MCTFTGIVFLSQIKLECFLGLGKRAENLPLEKLPFQSLEDCRRGNVNGLWNSRTATCLTWQWWANGRKMQRKICFPMFVWCSLFACQPWALEGVQLINKWNENKYKSFHLSLDLRSAQLESGCLVFARLSVCRRARGHVRRAQRQQNKRVQGQNTFSRIV